MKNTRRITALGLSLGLFFESVIMPVPVMAGVSRNVWVIQEDVFSFSYDGEERYISGYMDIPGLTEVTEAYTDNGTVGYSVSGERVYFTLDNGSYYNTPVMEKKTATVPFEFETQGTSFSFPIDHKATRILNYTVDPGYGTVTSATVDSNPYYIRFNVSKGSGKSIESGETNYYSDTFSTTESRQSTHIVVRDYSSVIPNLSKIVGVNTVSVHSWEREGGTLDYSISGNTITYTLKNGNVKTVTSEQLGYTPFKLTTEGWGWLTEWHTPNEYGDVDFTTYYQDPMNPWAGMLIPYDTPIIPGTYYWGIHAGRGYANKSTTEEGDSITIHLQDWAGSYPMYNLGFRRTVSKDFLNQSGGPWDRVLGVLTPAYKDSNGEEILITSDEDIYRDAENKDLMKNTLRDTVHFIWEKNDSGEDIIKSFDIYSDFHFVDETRDVYWREPNESPNILNHYKLNFGPPYYYILAKDSYQYRAQVQVEYIQKTYKYKGTVTYEYETSTSKTGYIYNGYIKAKHWVQRTVTDNPPSPATYISVDGRTVRWYRSRDDYTPPADLRYDIYYKNTSDTWSLLAGNLTGMTAEPPEFITYTYGGSSIPKAADGKVWIKIVTTDDMGQTAEGFNDPNVTLKLTGSTDKTTYVQDETIYITAKTEGSPPAGAVNVSLPLNTGTITGTLTVTGKEYVPTLNYYIGDAGETNSEIYDDYQYSNTKTFGVVHWPHDPPGSNALENTELIISDWCNSQIWPSYYGYFFPFDRHNGYIHESSNEGTIVLPAIKLSYSPEYDSVYGYELHANGGIIRIAKEFYTDIRHGDTTSFFVEIVRIPESSRYETYYEVFEIVTYDKDEPSPYDNNQSLAITWKDNHIRLMQPQGVIWEGDIPAIENVFITGISGINDYYYRGFDNGWSYSYSIVNGIYTLSSKAWSFEEYLTYAQNIVDSDTQNWYKPGRVISWSPYVYEKPSILPEYIKDHSPYIPYDAFWAGSIKLPHNVKNGTYVITLTANNGSPAMLQLPITVNTPINLEANIPNPTMDIGSTYILEAYTSQYVDDGGVTVNIFGNNYTMTKSGNFGQYKAGKQKWVLSVTVPSGQAPGNYNQESGQFAKATFTATLPGGDQEQVRLNYSVTRPYPAVSGSDLTGYTGDILNVTATTTGFTESVWLEVPGLSAVYLTPTYSTGSNANTWTGRLAIPANYANGSYSIVYKALNSRGTASETRTLTVSTRLDIWGTVQKPDYITWAASIPSGEKLDITVNVRTIPDITRIEYWVKGAGNAVLFSGTMPITSKVDNVATSRIVTDGRLPETLPDGNYVVTVKVTTANGTTGQVDLPYTVYTPIYIAAWDVNTGTDEVFRFTCEISGVIQNVSSVTATVSGTLQTTEGTLVNPTIELTDTLGNNKYQSKSIKLLMTQNDGSLPVTYTVRTKNGNTASVTRALNIKTVLEITPEVEPANLPASEAVTLRATTNRFVKEVHVQLPHGTVVMDQSSARPADEYGSTFIFVKQVTIPAETMDGTYTVVFEARGYNESAISKSVNLAISTPIGLYPYLNGKDGDCEVFAGEVNIFAAKTTEYPHYMEIEFNGKTYTSDSGEISFAENAYGKFWTLEVEVPVDFMPDGEHGTAIYRAFLPSGRFEEAVLGYTARSIKVYDFAVTMINNVDWRGYYFNLDEPILEDGKVTGYARKQNTDITTGNMPVNKKPGSPESNISHIGGGNLITFVRAGTAVSGRILAVGNPEWIRFRANYQTDEGAGFQWIEAVPGKWVGSAREYTFTWIIPLETVEDSFVSFDVQIGKGGILYGNEKWKDIWQEGNDNRGVFYVKGNVLRDDLFINQSH